MANLTLPDDQNLNEIWDEAQKLYTKGNFRSALQKLQSIIPYINSEKYYPFLNLAGLISLRIDDNEKALEIIINLFKKSFCGFIIK